MHTQPLQNLKSFQEKAHHKKPKWHWKFENYLWIGTATFTNKNHIKNKQSHENIFSSLIEILEQLQTTRDHTHLVTVQFHMYQWHTLIHLVVLFDNPMNSILYILKHQVKVQLILLCRWKEAMLQRENIWMVKKAHSLQLSVLVPLVLKNFLYGYRFTILQTFCLYNSNKSLFIIYESRIRIDCHQRNS